MDFEVRPAEWAEVVFLPEIERRAARLFAQVGLGYLAGGPVTPVEEFERACAANCLWVVCCGEEIVGFALASRLGAGLHLQEMDVVPEHGRRGLGQQLVKAVCQAASRRGLSGVTLTTFRDVPWNAPFYRRLGFRELLPGQFTPELRGLTAREQEAGLPTQLRCVMEWLVRQ